MSSEDLEPVRRAAASCVRCPQLAEGRTQVVFGAGDADANVLFVGEAPGRGEDEHGRPLTGRPGELLDELLAGIGLSRGEVFVTDAVKCRPPGNRDPLSAEAANCRAWLLRQLELVAPKVVCSLGNAATRIVRGDTAPVTRIHGVAEVRVVGTRAVRLLPLLHPAAALYSPPLMEALRSDFALIPGLLAAPPVEQPRQPAPEPPESDSGPQLGLF